MFFWWFFFSWKSKKTIWQRIWTTVECSCRRNLHLRYWLRFQFFIPILVWTSGCFGLEGKDFPLLLIYLNQGSQISKHTTNVLEKIGGNQILLVGSCIQDKKCFIFFFFLTSVEAYYQLRSIILVKKKYQEKTQWWRKRRKRMPPSGFRFICNIAMSSIQKSPF